MDDCAEAYVATVECGDRAVVKEQCYNICGNRYETIGEFEIAPVREYGVVEGQVYTEEGWGKGRRCRTDADWFQSVGGSETLKEDAG